VKQKERKNNRLKIQEGGKDYASHLIFLFGLVKLCWWNYIAVKLSEIRLRVEAKPRIFSPPSRIKGRAAIAAELDGLHPN
jgi:hypothetical protein